MLRNCAAMAATWSLAPRRSSHSIASQVAIMRAMGCFKALARASARSDWVLRALVEAGQQQRDRQRRLHVDERVENERRLQRLFIQGRRRLDALFEHGDRFARRAFELEDLPEQVAGGHGQHRIAALQRLRQAALGQLARLREVRRAGTAQAPVRAAPCCAADAAASPPWRPAPARTTARSRPR